MSSAPPRSRRNVTSPLRDLHHATPPMRGVRALLLPLLTALIPGSAQLVAGHRMMGKIGIRVWLVTVLAGLVALGTLIWNRGFVVDMMSQTWPVFFVSLGAFTLALGWAVLFADAWRLGLSWRPRVLSGLLSSMLTICLVVATSGPLIYAGQLLTAHHRMIGSVFAAGDSSKPVEGRYNLLLIGGDAGSGREGLRNDTNILLSIDAATGRVIQIGIPRNLERAPFPASSPMAKEHPDGFRYAADDRKLNAVYRWGHEHPELYPGKADPGAEAVKDAVSGITGLSVQFYALVDMAGFESMINALGGVEIDVRKRVPKASTTDRKATEYIEPGRQRLDGADALWFARSRFDSSDYERMARQRCVVQAAMNQIDPATILTRYSQIAGSSSNLITTDVTQGQLGDLGSLGLKARGQETVNLQLTPPLVNTGKPDYDEIHELVANALLDAAKPAQVAPPSDAGDAGDTGGTGSTGGGGAGGGAGDDEATTGENANDTEPDVVCTAG